MTLPDHKLMDLMLCYGSANCGPVYITFSAVGLLLLLQLELYTARLADASKIRCVFLLQGEVSTHLVMETVYC